jgi:enamine deaminase RidA (YjgF/YER057c/UK114 family)
MLRKFEFNLHGNGRSAIAALAMTVLLIVPLAASAQTTKQIPLPPSQNPSNADLPISAAVWAGNTLYVSGWLDPDLKTHTGTKEQPGKPARTTTQVVLPAGARGALIEIDLIAVRPN